MGRHIVVVMLDPLDKAEMARLIQELRQLGLAPSNGHGVINPTPGSSEAQQGRQA